MRACRSAALVTRIAVVYETPNTFIERDIASLEDVFDVERVQWRGLRGLPHMRRAVGRADLVFNWFAAEHAGFSTMLARQAGKPVLTIVGGYDAARVRDIDYGLYTWAWRHRWLGRRAARGADRLLCVDPSLVDEVVRNGGAPPENVDVLPTGYDPSEWIPLEKRTGRPVVLTVTAVSATTIRRKGLITFKAVARAIPEADFVLVGKLNDEEARRYADDAPENLRLTGFVSDAGLRNWMGIAHVYCQLSRYEGLPNALCEAMLCGCVPVGTQHCGIPNAIGETGLYADYGDVDGTTEAVRTALGRPAPSESARARIAERFPATARAQGLVDAVNGLLRGD